MITDEIYEQSSGYETKNEAKKACLDKLIELELAK
jgi:hypothetical protein